MVIMSSSRRQHAALGEAGQRAVAMQHLASGFKGQDRRGDLRQITVELVVAARQTMDARLRNRACIEVQMRRWRDFIIKPLRKMDRDILRKART
jgi:hypothetical protein